MGKTIQETNTVPVYEECDVLVVGGGAAGHSAAIAAARAGAKKVIILERYGYFGGDVTGGYVLMIPTMSWYNKSFVRGLQEEWFTRLDKSAPGSYICPSLKEIGDTSPVLIDRWSLIHGCTSMWAENKRLVRAPYYEPNQLKIELDLMIQEEPNVKVMFHSWATKPVMDGNVVKGVFFESKEGRHVILSKITIDATGDGDIFAQAGAPFLGKRDASTRVDKTALVWRMGGVDFEAYARWARQFPAENASFRDELAKIGGFRTAVLPTERNDVVWFNNFLPAKDCIKIKDLTATELEVRTSIRDVIEFCRKAVPFAFRNAFLYDIAPQLGARCSRRLDGEHVMTQLDVATAAKFEDVIAWHSIVGPMNDSGPVELPYRCILPKKVENLICPGRHLAADEIIIDTLLLIPQCVGLGQAAGVAAAVAANDGTTAHKVDIKKVQRILSEEQDVPLPRQRNTDPEMVQLCEDHHYGIMNERAKKIRAAAGLDW